MGTIFFDVANRLLAPSSDSGSGIAGKVAWIGDFHHRRIPGLF
jgi:hypothetical protein